MRHARLALAAVVLAALAAAAPPAATRPTTAPAAPASQPAEVMTTSLSPQDAAEKIAIVFEPYRACRIDVTYFGDDPTPHTRRTRGNDVVASGNYFESGVYLNCDGNKTLQAACQWVRPGQTTVQFSSDGLPAGADEMIRGQVRDALAKTAAAGTGG